MALVNRRDSYHDIAVISYRQMRKEGYKPVTSDYILDEFISTAFNRIQFKDAHQFIEGILKASRSEEIILERIDEDRFNSAWLLRGMYKDKPDISFTDLTSFTLMRELGIKEVFTGDLHFQKVGMGFEMIPQTSSHY